MTVQFRTSTPAASSYPLDQLEAQKQLIKEYIDEEAVLKSRISLLRDKIDTSLKNNEALIKTSNLETLNRLKASMGLTLKSGEGFTIELNDSPFIDRDNIPKEEPGLVYAADIRDLVNLLRSHKVEGIAINGQRVIAASTITSVGNTVMINNSHLAPPFTVSAIGDFDSLMLRLQDPATLTDLQKRVTENGIRFSIQKSPYVILPVYNGLFHTNFIQAATNETI